MNSKNYLVEVKTVMTFNVVAPSKEEAEKMAKEIALVDNGTATVTFLEEENDQ